MLIDSEKANEMQSSLDAVFNRLPQHFQTKPMRLEMAKAIIRSMEDSPCGYRKAAEEAVLLMFDRPEQAVKNRVKLAPFAELISAAEPGHRRAPP
jgi:hypothetical protein